MVAGWCADEQTELRDGSNDCWNDPAGLIVEIGLMGRRDIQAAVDTSAGNPSDHLEDVILFFVTGDPTPEHDLAMLRHDLDVFGHLGD